MAHIVCRVEATTTRVSITWTQGPDAFAPYHLVGQHLVDFHELIHQVRDRLHVWVKAYHQYLNKDLKKERQVDGAPTMVPPEPELAQACFRLAFAGHELRRRLFKPSEGQRTANEVSSWLKGLVDASEKPEVVLEIVTEGWLQLPWNALYDSIPDERAFSEWRGTDHWNPFWGISFNLAVSQRVDVLRVTPLRRVPWQQKPSVLLVIDPVVRQELQPVQQRRLTTFVNKHGLQVIDNKEELIAALQRGRPDLLYWMAHATPDALYLGQGQNNWISPTELVKLLELSEEVEDHEGGLIFLNACRTAVEAESTGSFLKAIFGLKMSGLIATEDQTIDTFACPFGIDFLEDVLHRNRPVGAAMQALRARVPDDLSGYPHAVLLGLLYTTYCPPELQVVRTVGSRPTSRRTSKVKGGVTLGGNLLGPDQSGPLPLPLPDMPYPALHYYRRQDRPLYAGRNDDILRVAQILGKQDTHVMLLHGECACGKSSFLRAGLLPYLEQECVGYRVLDDGTAEESPLFVRATGDLAGQLSQAFTSFCREPWTGKTPLGQPLTVDLPKLLSRELSGPATPELLREALIADPRLASRVLATLGNELPFTVVIVIDQGEEIFSLNWRKEDAPLQLRALELLRAAAATEGNFKIVVALRTEYYGRLIDGLRRGVSDAEGVRDYLLRDLDVLRLTEAIERPTSKEPAPYSDETPREKYGFRYADGFANEFAQKVIDYTRDREDSALPMAQVIATQLYDLVRTRENKEIGANDLRAIGGVEGGLEKHVDRELQELFPLRWERKRALRLLSHLCRRQPDGTMTTEMLTVADAKAKLKGPRRLFEEVLTVMTRDRDVRLLRLSTVRRADGEIEVLTLGHDALAPAVTRLWQKADQLRQKVMLVLGVLACVAMVFGIIGVVWVLTDSYSNVEKISAAHGEPLRQHLKTENGWLTRWFAKRRLAGLQPDDQKLWQLRMLVLPETPTDQTPLLKEVILKQKTKWEDVFVILEGLNLHITSKDERESIQASFHSELRKTLPEDSSSSSNDVSATKSKPDQNDDQDDDMRSFRAGVALSLLGEHDEFLAKRDWEFLALMMCQGAPEDSAIIREQLKRVKEQLNDGLRKILTRAPSEFRDFQLPAAIPDLWKQRAAYALRDYNVESVDELCELAASVEPERFNVFLKEIHANASDWQDEADKAVRSFLEIANPKPLSDDQPGYEHERVAIGKRRALAALSLLRLDQELDKTGTPQTHSKVNEALEKVLVVPRFSPDSPGSGDPEAQSQFIHSYQSYNVPVDVIWKEFNNLPQELPAIDPMKKSWEYSDDVRFALLLCLGKGQESLRSDIRDLVKKKAERLYREHPFPAIHGAARWLLIELKWPQTINDKSEFLDRTLDDQKAIYAYFAKLDQEIFDLHQRQNAQNRLWFIRKLPLPSGDVYRTFVRCNAGCSFTIGEPKESQHRLRDFNRPKKSEQLLQSFAICTQEVTQEEFASYLYAMNEERAKGNVDKELDWQSSEDGKIRQDRADLFSKDPHQPMTRARWTDANNFCRWLNRLAMLTGTEPEQLYVDFASIDNDKHKWEVSDGNNTIDYGVVPQFQGYRLPTQNEWECACRAGTATSFGFGSDERLAVQYAWFWENRPRDLRSKLGGQMMPNLWGLSDMHGNMTEWCQDYGFNIADNDDIKGPDTVRRAARGGGWLEPALKCRSAWLYKHNPTMSDAGIGFRLVVGVESIDAEGKHGQN